MMDDLTIRRYQPGGDIYATLQGQYAKQDVDNIAAAALTGDRTKVTDAIEIARGHGTERETSTLAILGNQLTTDPLGAPLDTLNTAATNTLFSFLKNPMALIVIGTVLFLALGGSARVTRWAKG